MDLNREDLISKQKDFQTQGSWIPVTPAKPILEKTQLSHTNREVLTDGCSTGLSQENEACQVADDCEDKERRVQKIPIVYKARRNNVSFVELLDKASTGTISPASSNMASSYPYDCGFNPPIENSWTSKSLRVTKDRYLGLKLCTNNTRQCERPIPFHRPYDLCVLPNVIADELSSRATPRFAPITPDKRRIHKENLNGQEKIPSHADDSSVPVVSTSVTENPSPEKESSEVINLSKKQSRRKHRPKVIIEGKAERERKSPLLKSDASKENATLKRKYVRKKGIDEIDTENPDPKAVDITKISARKNLKFQLKGEEIHESYECKSADVNPEAQEQQSSRSKIQLATETSVQTGQEHEHVKIAYDLVCSANRYLQDYICQEPNTQSPLNINLPPKKRKANTQMETADEKRGDGPINMEKGKKIVSSPNNSAAEKKRESTHILDANHPSTMNPVETQCKGLQENYETFQVQDYNNMNFGMHFPVIYKKRRTEKGETLTPSSSSTSSSSMTTTKNDVQLLQERMQNHVNSSFSESKSNTWIFSPRLQNQRRRSLRHRKRWTKSNFASFKENADTQLLVNFPAVRAFHRPQNCIQALMEDEIAKLAKGKRSKIQKSLTSLIVSSRDAVQMRQENVVYIHHKILSKPDPPPVVVWKHVNTVDAITERLGDLNINLKTNLVSCPTYNALVPYDTRYQCHNAPDPYHLSKRLIIYRRDGTIVPFDGSFYTIKKRRPRAKVDLDEETSRVWKLLLENINNEGINGTGEQNEKWWEDERKVFCGRADSFIARMHLVQGDRQFSKWKGSIVDSVVGVFLTQNVSDHLSSSAFMSLAAHFPLKENCNEQQYCAEGTNILVDEPVSDQSSVTLNESEQNEETEVDIQTCQSSVDSSPAQTDEKRLEQLSEAQYPETIPNSSSFNGPASVQKVLYMDVGPTLNQNHNHESCQGQSDKSSVDASGHRNSTLTPSLILQEVDCIECCEEKNLFFYSKKDEKITTESFSISTFGTKLTGGDHELQNVNQDITHEEEQPRDMPVKETKNVESLIQNELQQNKSPDILGEASYVTESSSVFNTEHKETEPNLNEHNQSSNKTFNQTTTDGLGTKSKGVGNEKNRNVDWDSLRKQAQVNGVRERIASTEDSVDWEAVRCADVDEIAETIKARGVNNILAGRIKDFLSRVVNQHGSLDLEWLRDVPPDKAKEYLLSVRGLGLKSVECVRLLTLHHLAFPVDTNVGRIAVRLGWVPLQPLPESLQLHLLELYPVLESIQKYLWPRLCKLDQKTLYELHYQMITFGKVFCTKSKPNCNACPMRAECRHFASAFASARLALPGPEEKRIVSATENRENDHAPAIITSRLQLPSPHVEIESEANHFPEAKSGTSNKEPIIEEPATPETERVHMPELDIEESVQIPELDIEDQFYEDPDEIPTIKLNIEEFTQNLEDYMKKNMELQDGDMSRALVALSQEAASIPTPKLKYISRLRTEHQVYELPDAHPLLQGLDKRERDDPCPYLLAIWTAGETVSSIQPPSGSSSHEVGKMCSELSCFSCNSIREANAQTVRGTLLIPCRTAMRGSFPLNGTYFQVNEVFADHESSLRPMDVPRACIWNLPRRTVFFGTSIPTIFKGLTTEDIQYCFWKGFVCVRGFDRKERAPRPLIARLHFPASKRR